MDANQRLLALDAALCAAEGAGAPQNLLNPLQDWLDDHFTANGPQDFGEYLTAQKQAVELLATNPQVFGGI